MILRVKKSIFTQEEREALSKEILTRLMSGNEDSEIAKACNCSIKMVSTITLELIASKLIKREDIIEARERERKRNRRIGIPLSKEHRRKCKKSILESIKKGILKSNANLALDFRTSAPTIAKIIEELINENLATEDEVKKAKRNNKYVREETEEMTKEEVNKISSKNQALEKIRNLRLKLKGKLRQNDNSMDMIEEYISIVKENFEENWSELGTDIKLFRSIILKYPNLITSENINLIITYYTRMEDYLESMKFINKCIDVIPTNEKELIRKIKRSTEIDKRYARKKRGR